MQQVVRLWPAFCYLAFRHDEVNAGRCSACWYSSWLSLAVCSDAVAAEEEVVVAEEEVVAEEVVVQAIPAQHRGPTP
jgi:hypothetical protein